MKHYVETDNRIRIEMPSDTNNDSKDKNKTKTESKKTTKEVRILMESSSIS